MGFLLLRRFSFFLQSYVHEIGLKLIVPYRVIVAGTDQLLSSEVRDQIRSQSHVKHMSILIIPFICGIHLECIINSDIVHY